MATVANRKFSEMRQIEFQQNGSASISAMLLQPLLEKSSTWVCEVTDLQCNLGEELAFPENEHLFTIVERPQLTGYETHLSLNSFADAVNTLPDVRFDEWFAYGYLAAVDNIFGNTYSTFIQEVAGTEDGASDMPNNNYVWSTQLALNQAIENLHENYIPVSDNFYSGRYYSTLDMVHDLAVQLTTWNKKRQAAADQTTWDEVQDFVPLVNFAVDAGGNLKFTLHPNFTKRFFIVLSPLFQQLTNLPLLLGYYHGNELIQTVEELREKPRVAAPPTMGGDDEYIVDVPGTLVGPVTFTSRDFSIHTGIDVRKKLILEASLPLPHTLAWDGQKESTRYVLQEFLIPSGLVETKYISHPQFSLSNTQLRQDQRQGSMLLLSGGSNLALKKMFEGQLQAFRLTLVIELDQYDKKEKAFKRIRRPVNMSGADFVYLKLLFTKETV